MKSTALIVAALAVAGAAGAYGYLRWRSSPPPPPARFEQTDQESAGTHGQQISSAEGSPLCAKHRVPESMDAFCHPEVIEAMGFCGEHDVPEAFCTRCSPILIAAFKAEGDWCAEHELPESQCVICKQGS